MLQNLFLRTMRRVRSDTICVNMRISSLRHILPGRARLLLESGLQ
jgi:hypothetical protein